jgi:FtsP/CotA-like multicopper oxidase with cupredoxin domain
MSEGPSVSVPRPPTVLQVVRLQAAAHTWEVAPGRVVHGAAFEDQVPGPTIEARAGDTLTVFSNRLTEPTGVRWKVLDSPDDATAAAPGTSQQYTVHLSRRGLYLHRSAAGPLGGLVGAVIVRDPTSRSTTTPS